MPKSKTPAQISEAAAKQEDKERKTRRKALAEKFYDAIENGTHAQVDSIAKEIDAENKMGPGARVPITKVSANKSLAKRTKGDKDLVKSIINLTHAHLFGGGRTRRNSRKSRRTRKNGF